MSTQVCSAAQLLHTSNNDRVISIMQAYVIQHCIWVQVEACRNGAYALRPEGALCVHVRCLACAPSLSDGQLHSHTQRVAQLRLASPAGHMRKQGSRYLSHKP
jgi:hypothetical protein